MTLVSPSFYSSKGNRIRHCIESELLKCGDPTPANVVNSMLLAMREATPCKHDAHQMSRLSGATSHMVGGAHAATVTLLLAAAAHSSSMLCRDAS